MPISRLELIFSYCFIRLRSVHSCISFRISCSSIAALSASDRQVKEKLERMRVLPYIRVWIDQKHRWKHQTNYNRVDDNFLNDKERKEGRKPPHVPIQTPIFECSLVIPLRYLKERKKERKKERQAKTHRNGGTRPSGRPWRPRGWAPGSAPTRVRIWSRVRATF